MLVSIIMPNFNGEKYLEKSIKAFMNQDYKNKELVIVDDISIDSSHKIIKNYSDKYKEIVWVKEKDRGISNAINIGIKHAKGDIIGYLGSDDILLSGVFKKINEMASTIDFDAIYFNSYSYRIDLGNKVNPNIPSVPLTYKNFLEIGTIVGLQNIFFKKEIFDIVSYDERNKYCMDYELYLQLLHIKPEALFLYIDKYATINIFDGNISGSQTEKQLTEAQKVKAKYTKIYSKNKPSLKERILKLLKRK